MEGPPGWTWVSSTAPTMGKPEGNAGGKPGKASTDFGDLRKEDAQCAHHLAIGFRVFAFGDFGSGVYRVQGFRVFRV